MSDHPAAAAVTTSRTGMARASVQGAAWTGLLLLAMVVNVQTIIADMAAMGRQVPGWQPWALEGSSTLLWFCLLPLIYRLHRRFPLGTGWRNVAVHAAATVPISLIHVYGMFALRRIAWQAMGEAYRWPDLGVLVYEWRKDLITYVILSGVLIALDYLLSRGGAPWSAPAAEPMPAEPAMVPEAPRRLDRFAVKRKGREVMVSAADIAWIEAAGNYAVLHVGDERFEIRSSLSKLEAELDPAQFVRTHKSSMVNLAKVREVEPWFNGDYRIRLEGGAIVNLSRRYRGRFESMVPVKG